VVGPTRKTDFNIDIYTGLLTRNPEDAMSFYFGDDRANKIYFNLTNQGEAVDSTGYEITLRFVRPDTTEVFATVARDDAGTLFTVIPAPVYNQVGIVTMNLSLSKQNETITVNQARIRIRDKAGIDSIFSNGCGLEAVSVEKLFEAWRMLEESLSIFAEGDPTMLLVQRLRAIEAFAQRDVGFATSEQGSAGESALSNITYENIFNLVLEAINNGMKGIDASSVNGVPAEDIVNKNELGQIITELGGAATLNAVIPAVSWAIETDMYVSTVAVDGIKTDGFLYQPAPALLSHTEFSKCGVLMRDITTDDTITFQAAKAPENDLQVIIAAWKLAEGAEET